MCRLKKILLLFPFAWYESAVGITAMEVGTAFEGVSPHRKGSHIEKVENKESMIKQAMLEEEISLVKEDYHALEQAFSVYHLDLEDHGYILQQYQDRLKELENMKERINLYTSTKLKTEIRKITKKYVEFNDK